MHYSYRFKACRQVWGRECVTSTGQKRLRLCDGGMELLEMARSRVKLSMTSLGEGTVRQRS